MRIKRIIKSLIIILLLLAIALTVYYFVSKGKKDKTEVEEVDKVVTNSYNKSIAQNKLTTDKYKGRYTFSKVNDVVFNEYSEENQTGLTEDEINEIYKKYGITNGGKSDFCQILSSKKSETAQNEKEYILIEIPVDVQNNSVKNGIYRKKTDHEEVFGTICGDENLAYVSISSENKSKNLFMSINYSKFNNAVNVSENIVAKENTIYIFENVYSSTDPSRKLYTITYEYVSE